MKTFSHILFIIILSINANYLSAQNEWEFSKDSSSKIRNNKLNLGFVYGLYNLKEINNELLYNNLPELNNSLIGFGGNLNYKEVRGVGEYDHIHWRYGGKLSFLQKRSSNDSMISIFSFADLKFNFSWDLIPKDKRGSIFVGGGLGFASYQYNANPKNTSSFSSSLNSSTGSPTIYKNDIIGTLLCSFEFFRDAVLSASYNFNLVNGSWRLLGKGIQNNNKIEGGPNFGLGYFQLGLFTYF